MIEAGFGLTLAVEILASVQVENAASKSVLEKCGFTHVGTGPQGAPARGGMTPCHSFRLGREAWAEGGALRHRASAGLAHAS
jgi:RimJ/RimL family protein N-acetyltransferase